MASFMKCAAGRRVVLVYTRCRSRYGGWFALEVLVRFAARLRIERLHRNHV